MEFVIAKKDFNSAVRQILVGREPTSMEPVDVTVDQSSLRLEAMGTDVEVPVETTTPGVARISISNVAVLKKISADGLDLVCVHRSLRHPGKSYDCSLTILD